MREGTEKGSYKCNMQLFTEDASLTHVECAVFSFFVDNKVKLQNGLDIHETERPLCTFIISV